MAFELKPLPYAYDALAPHISRETLEYHHDKHHKAYVDKLNGLIKGTALENATLEEIIRKAPAGPMFNNAAQVWNHDFYWDCLTPKAAGKPSGKLASEIATQFGSFAEFQEKFTEGAVGTFGSGWMWLVRKADGGLGLLSTSNADNPVRAGTTALLACDVWEHAYYIDRRNERAAHLKDYWEIVNWDFVAAGYGNGAISAAA